MSATILPSAASAVTADAFHDLAARSRAPMELVRGVVRMMSPTSFVHGVVCGRVFLMVAAHVQGHQLGWCVTEATGFRLVIPGDQADTVRAPDVAFVARERLPLLPPTGFARLAPDLAVEVLSPDQTASDMMERLADYFAAGTRLFWVVDPRTRRVTVHAPEAPMRVLREGDTLGGGTVVPGLAIALAELFRDVPREPAPRARADEPPGATVGDATPGA